MNYIVIELKQPYFSASQRYGWENGVWGFGINLSLIEKAILEKRKILVKWKTSKYEITGKNALKHIKKWDSYFVANGIKLGVIPKSVFKRLPDDEEQTKIEQSVMERLKEEFNKKYA